MGECPLTFQTQVRHFFPSGGKKMKIQTRPTVEMGKTAKDATTVKEDKRTGNREKRTREW
jgi:hypothetical protein